MPNITIPGDTCKHSLYFNWVKIIPDMAQEDKRHPWGSQGSRGCDEQVYGGEIGEKERQSGSRAMIRGRFEEMGSVRNGLMLVACLPSGTRVTSGSGLLTHLSYHSCDLC